MRFFVWIMTLQFVLLIYLCIYMPSCHIKSKSPEYYFTYGNYYIDQKKYLEAQKYFTKAIKLNEENYEAYKKRAFCYEKTDSTILALKDYEKMISLDSINMDEIANVYYNMGNLNSCLREDSVACENWEKSCELNYNKACDILRHKCK